MTTNGTPDLGYDAPEWSVELLGELGEDLITLDVFYKRAEVYMAQHVLAHWMPNEQRDWIREESPPEWMRLLCRDYSMARSRWERVGILARLDEALVLLGEQLDTPPDDKGLHERDVQVLPDGDSSPR